MPDENKQENEYIWQKPEDTEIKQKMEDGWIKAWFAIEVLGVNKEVAENAMKTHIDNLCKQKAAVVIDRKFSEITESDFNIKGEARKGFSQTCEVTLIFRNFLSLLDMVTLFGPSAIEILGPKTKEITIEEMQNISNAISGLVHQFAAAGIGGLVIRGEKGMKSPYQ